MAGTRREDHRRWRSVLFCREQKSTKRVAPEGANLRFAPSGLPHSRHASWVRAHPCRSQHPAERRLLGSSLRPRSYSPGHSPEPTLGRLTIDAPPRRPPVRPGGGVCGTNGCWNEVFGERFTARMRFDVSDSARRGGHRRWRSVLFCYATEKEQFDYAEGIIKFKRMHPRGANLRIRPP